MAKSFLGQNTSTLSASAVCELIHRTTPCTIHQFHFAHATGIHCTCRIEALFLCC
jgi:hypothetical protein